MLLTNAGHSALTASPRVWKTRCLLARPALRSSTAPSSSTATVQHLLPDGASLEVLVQRAKAPAADGTIKPPILFVHGSYHAGWAWQLFQPYFAQLGYDSYALSMRGQGGSSPLPSGSHVSGTLGSHADDIADVVAQLLPRPPVVVSHSVGGLIMQKFLLGEGRPPLAGLAFLCCVPPSGNKKLVGRFIMRDPILSAKVTWGFVTRSFARSADACRLLFFSDDLPDNQLAEYQRILAEASPARLIDLADMNKQVPLPEPTSFPPVLVLGGAEDKVVDTEAVEELAARYRVVPMLLPHTAHDCMLDTRWQLAAELVARWLRQLPG